MIQIEQLAESALRGEALQLRSLAQDFLREHPRLDEVAEPLTHDERVLATSAALLELFAMRSKQSPPAWTHSVKPLTESIFLLKAATTMKRLRALCEAESPMPLRKRRLYAPPNYLEFA